MLFGSSQKTKKAGDLKLSMHGEILGSVKKFKYLGLIFDTNLHWNKHINKIVSKVSQKAGVMKRLSKYISPSTLKTLYNTLVQPHFDYCCAIWTNTSDKHVNRLQVMQNKIRRIILGCKIREIHVKDMYKKLHLMSIRERATYYKATMMYRCLNNKAPSYLIKSVKSNFCSHTYATRAKTANKLNNGKVNTEFGKRTFEYTSSTLWNTLPSEVRNASNLNIFKTEVKTFICKTR